MEKEVKRIQKQLMQIGTKKNAQLAQRFFKTGAGEYGEGDMFLGIRVPVVRKFSKKLYFTLREKPVQNILSSLDILLKNKYHECRLSALQVLVHLSEYYTQKERVFDIHALSVYYLKRMPYINNWDLVDTSATQVVGKSVYMQKDIHTLLSLSKSNSVWERRVAVIAAWYFTKQNDVQSPLQVITCLENDAHDLIHKACGWMLREIGKVDIKALTLYLDVKASVIPRTMLRYAIERLPLGQKKRYMSM